ncbi:hypothetical protein BGZ94_007955 [Podila epigama]|nr:hypothetical protein BGZ94_007955 [Podila epigama]
MPETTQLKGLRLEVYHVLQSKTYELVEANPGLASLEIFQNTLGVFGQLAALPTLLKPLTNLRQLNLSGHPRLEPAELKSILDSNPRLESLGLDILRVTNPDFDAWRNYPDIKKLRFQHFPAVSTWLFSLLQHCPNVEELSIIEVPFREACDSRPQKDLLFKILQEHCSKVKFLKYTEHDSNRPIALSQKDYGTIFHAANNLVHLWLALDVFDKVICSAILRESAHSLEAFGIDIYGDASSKETFASAGQILSSCPKLEHFQLSFDDASMYSSATDKALVAKPWVCKKLKTITLRQAKVPRFQSCNSNCRGKNECLDEITFHAKISKQGWKNLINTRKFHHNPSFRKKHRDTILGIVNSNILNGR